VIAELRDDVYALAGTIGERNLLAPGAYADAARFIENALRRAGYAPVIDDASNVAAEISGGDDVVIVGAHYDTVPGSPGADDNASGVAALLAMARQLWREKPKRTLRFVAFANEEPPYFMSEQMGSWSYAKRCRDRRERVVAMLSIEAIGLYSDAPGSQQYPALLEGAYPNVANFIAFVSNVQSRALLQRCVEIFRHSADVPCEAGALPEEVEGVAWSDQWSFWRFGYPAVMVTDTALFRNPHYHTRNDLPDTLDYARLAKTTEGLMAVVRDLALT
jgi:Zn-dependent M28 family amino/carboxypeptidase